MLYHLIVFLPLVGFLIAGLFGSQIGAKASEYVTSGLLVVSAVLSWYAFITVGLFLFHYIHYDTALWQTMLVMVLFGIGLGFNFQPLTLAVQTAVPRHQIGVATSTATFSFVAHSACTSESGNVPSVSMISVLGVPG